MKCKKIVTQVALLLTGLGMSGVLFAHGMSEADKQLILDAGYDEFIWLGASHMLSGYDHLLFLLGVVFFLKRFGDIVKFITAFTLGHSITLVLATLYGIQANYFLIDAVIALTVCYKGFENLDGFKRYIGVKAPSLIWMVFGFGLIHGMGFAGAFGDLGLPPGIFWPALIGFNVGVEIGQLAVIGMALAVAVVIRGALKQAGRPDLYRPVLVWPVSAAIGAIGLWWAIERTFLNS